MYVTDCVTFVVFILLELCHIDSAAQIDLLYSSLILPLKLNHPAICICINLQTPSEQSCGYRRKIPAMDCSC